MGKRQSEEQKFYETKQFEKLQKKWYAKIKTKGFEDIEHDEDHLKQYSINFTKNVESWRSPAVVDAKVAYYSMARKFYSEYPFKDKYDRSVFGYHVEGLGVRRIAKKIRSYRDKVHRTLQRLVKEMKAWKSGT